MKAELKFKLPEDTNEFIIAINGSNYYNSLWDMSGYLRHTLKHIDLTDEQDKIVGEIQDRFNEILDDNNVNLDEIE